MPKRPRTPSGGYTRRAKARKYSGTPLKARYKNAKARFKKGVGLSRRKFLLKNRKYLRGTYQPKSLSTKDYFTPQNEQHNKVVVNYQKGGRKKTINLSIASQQLVMQRRKYHELAFDVGRQGSIEIIHMNNAAYQDNSTTSGYIDAEIPNMWNIAAGTLLDGGTYTGATSGDILTGVQMRRQMLYVKSHKSNFTLTNVTNGAMKVSVYTIRHRQDTNGVAKHALATWQVESELNDNNDSVLALTNIGFGNFNSANLVTNPGARPQTNKNWNKMFGIIQQRHFTLDAGQIVNHTVHVKYNKYMNFNEVYPPTDEDETTVPSNVTTTIFKDWTVTTMIVAHGQIGIGSYDSGIPGIKYAPINTSGKLVIYHDEATKFYRVPIRSQSVFFRNDADVATAGGYFWRSNVEFAQDEDGDIVNNAQADGQ